MIGKKLQKKMSESVILIAQALSRSNTDLVKTSLLSLALLNLDSDKDQQLARMITSSLLSCKIQAIFVVFLPKHFLTHGS